MQDLADHKLFKSSHRPKISGLSESYLQEQSDEPSTVGCLALLDKFYPKQDYIHLVPGTGYLRTFWYCISIDLA